MGDLELLGQYAKRQSETAFTELVERHTTMVYSAALRQVNDPHLADKHWLSDDEVRRRPEFLESKQEQAIGISAFRAPALVSPMEAPPTRRLTR